MYNYKFNYDEENYEIHKKALKKVIGKPTLTMIGLLDIFIIIALWSLLCLVYKMTLGQYALSMMIILVVQIILSILLYRKIINASLKELKECRIEASFDENGFKYYNGDTLKITKWNGIKSIRAFDDFIIVQDAVNGFSINIMAFVNFNGSKQNVISAIEKYKEVRRK